MAVVGGGTPETPAFPDFTPTIPALVRRLAERFGSRELLVQGASRLTYAEAERRSARLARGLLALGVGKGTRVGLLMPNGPGFVSAWLAATRIGALAIPLSTFYRARELGWALRHADVSVLLTVDRFLSHDYLARLEEVAPSLRACRSVPFHVPELPYLRRVLVWGETARPWARPGGALDTEGPVDEALLREVEDSVHPADAAVVIYTSGSTAEPKGAVHSHGAIVRHVHNLNARVGIRAEDRVYTPMPFFWVGGLHTGLLSAMHVGACVLCDEGIFDPGPVLELLERERATLVRGWPHHGKALREHPDYRKRDLSSLRWGSRNTLHPPDAAPLDPELAPSWLGMTETFAVHACSRMDAPLPERLRGSFGTSLPGIEHRIVGGEIRIRGYALMQGLYKVEREDCFDPDGFYRTGDAGELDAEGSLSFRGRLGEMIKTGGANVSPREVETVLESLDGVQAAHVVGLPDAERGERVVAAVVARGGCDLDPEALRARLREELSAFKVPSRIVALRPEEVPMTDSAKVHKGRLRELLRERGAQGGPAGGER